MNPLTPEALVAVPCRLLARVPFALALIALAGCPDKPATTTPPVDTSTLYFDSDVDSGDTAVPDFGACRATYGGLGFVQPVTFAATRIQVQDPTSPCNVSMATGGGPQLLVTFDGNEPNGLNVRVEVGTLKYPADVTRVAYCQTSFGRPDRTFTLTELSFPALPSLPTTTIKLEAKTVDATGQVMRFEGDGWCAPMAAVGDPSDPFSFPVTSTAPFAHYTFEVTP